MDSINNMYDYEFQSLASQEIPVPLITLLNGFILLNSFIL